MFLALFFLNIHIFLTVSVCVCFTQVIVNFRITPFVSFKNAQGESDQKKQKQK